MQMRISAGKLDAYRAKHHHHNMGAVSIKEAAERHSKEEETQLFEGKSCELVRNGDQTDAESDGGEGEVEA